MVLVHRNVNAFLGTILLHESVMRRSWNAALLWLRVNYPCIFHLEIDVFAFGSTLRWAEHRERSTVWAKDLIKEAYWPAGRSRIYSKSNSPPQAQKLACGNSYCWNQLSTENTKSITSVGESSGTHGTFKRKRRRKRKQRIYILSGVTKTVTLKVLWRMSSWLVLLCVRREETIERKCSPSLNT